MDHTKIDMLGDKLAKAALTILVRTCRKEIKLASKSDLDAACAAMRARSKEVINRMYDDIQAAPWIAEQAFLAAALEMATPGIEVIRKGKV